MTAAPPASALEHPLLAALSAEQRQQVAEASRVLQFRVGQPLCEAELIPSEVLLLLSGSARLLAREQGQLVTLGKLDRGSVVGLASLLRAAPCEAVTASTPVVALAVPDALMLQLHQQQEGVRDWCAQELFPAELAALAAQLLAAAPRQQHGLIPALQALLQQAQAVAPSPEAIAAAQAQGLEVLVASANVPSAPLGEALPAGASVPAATPPLPLRLIGLPAALAAQLRQGGSATPSSEQAGTASEPAPEILQRSALDLGQSDPRQALQLIRGEGPLQETLATLRMVAQAMELPFRRDALEKIVADALQRGQSPSLQLLGQLTAGMGLHVHATALPRAFATRLQTPCLLQWQGAMVLVQRADASGIQLASPRQGLVTLERHQLAQELPEELEVLTLERTVSTPNQAFNFGWFWPAIRRHRGALIQVLIASLVVQLFTLANPLLIQVIIDKVIAQRSLDTLQVLGIALLAVTVLEGVLTSLRTFLFVETTNRIDTRLGAEVIDHLLRLPLGYFDKRPVGDLGTRLSELEKIRNFLTGQALTSIIDAVFSVIYIAVMAMYSWVLTLVALVVVPIQVAITLVGAPLFRRQFRQTAEANAATQSHLVEVLTGIQTVKAQNVELVSRWKWQERYSRYIQKTFEKTVTGTALNQTGQVLQQISQLMVLWVGAALVLDGQLTLGQLIAFRIIGGYVTQPLLRLSNIWQSVQELRVSFERLADVVDTPEESDATDQAKIPLPPLQGGVRFENVSFHFPGTTTNVLSHIDLEVPAGTFVGVVGRSGSGKSTLMKLISRLYAPQQGKLLIDGYDIDKVELYSLRRQIGIVPQDPLLFAGSVSENIALTNPEASNEAIVAAAQAACAHEFIMGLPAGYSTQLGERGAGLSGGQQQRLALARTLLANPQLLVLDEATSALDYDTEARVCTNLREQLGTRTVFFITHRLSTIRQANLIVLMDRGVIAESGTHEELMARRGGYYALYRQQEGQ